MKSLRLAQHAMQLIVSQVPAQTLARTSYCAAVVKLANGVRAVLISEAGASASGISKTLLDHIESGLATHAVIGCAAPTPGQGTWHMNDAEQQALRIIATGSTFQGATIKAVVANRAICASCTATLQQRGLQVVGAEAWEP